MDGLSHRSSGKSELTPSHVHTPSPVDKEQHRRNILLVSLVHIWWYLVLLLLFSCIDDRINITFERRNFVTLTLSLKRSGMSQWLFDAEASVDRGNPSTAKHASCSGGRHRNFIALYNNRLDALADACKWKESIDLSCRSDHCVRAKLKSSVKGIDIPMRATRQSDSDVRWHARMANQTRKQSLAIDSVVTMLSLVSLHFRRRCHRRSPRTSVCVQIECGCVRSSSLGPLCWHCRCSRLRRPHRVHRATLWREQEPNGNWSPGHSRSFS